MSTRHDAVQALMCTDRRRVRFMTKRACLLFLIYYANVSPGSMPRLPRDRQIAASPAPPASFSKAPMAICQQPRLYAHVSFFCSASPPFHSISTLQGANEPAGKPGNQKTMHCRAYRHKKNGGTTQGDVTVFFTRQAIYFFSFSKALTCASNSSRRDC